MASSPNRRLWLSRLVLWWMVYDHSLVVCLAKWYSQICVTGRVERITLDPVTGNITFEPDEHDAPNSTTTATPDPYYDPNISNRKLLRIPSHRHPSSRGFAQSFLDEVVLLSSAAPQDWNDDSGEYEEIPAVSYSHRRRVHTEALDNAFTLDTDPDPGTDTDTNTANGNGETRQPVDAMDEAGDNMAPLFYSVRPCLCDPAQLSPKLYHDNDNDDYEQAVPELFLCPASYDYCGIPVVESGDSPSTIVVGCFSISVQQVVARNSWPLILLWYFGVLVICGCTIHGTTSWDYVKTCCLNRQHTLEEVERLSEQQRQRTAVPPTSNWNWWGWQRFRLDQNLLAQAQWTWRNEEFARQQERIAHGLPPPRYELKTKRFDLEEYANHGSPPTATFSSIHLDFPDDAMADDEQQQQQQDPLDGSESSPEQPHHTHEDDDGNSLNEPTCTICFVPLENGDVIGDLPCNHLYHKDCLKAWCTRKNACPLCNVPIAQRRE